MSNGGFYFYSENKLSQIIKKIDYLIESPEKSIEIGNNARKFIIDNFSMETILTKFENENLNK